MTSDKMTFTISEYGLIGTDVNVESANGFLSSVVPMSVYKEFELFAKTDVGKDVLGFSNNGIYLQAKNYVGTIQTKSGYSLEILPKIYREKEGEEGSQKIFLQLLRILYKLPNYKVVNQATFEQVKMPLLEIFISMFLEEMGRLIKKGVKSDYKNLEENLHFLKGKMLINEQLKYNYIHKERFYVSHDEYSTNRAENRLLKSTLFYLSRLSKSYENIRLIRLYDEHLSNIPNSSNIDSDFRSSSTDVRGMKGYRTLLIWAKIFLKKESFSSFSGDTISFAILYPMEKLFENYVEHYLINKYSKLQIIPQCGQKMFVEGRVKAKVTQLFGVRPDYLIKKDNNIICVADAKWKFIDKEHSFSQSDFYQLFAYKHIYTYPNNGCVRLRLYYPMSEYITENKIFTYFDETKITVIPLDMNEIIKEKSWV